MRLPYPEAQTAPVHEKDMAALAMTALTEPGPGHQAYTIYGRRLPLAQRRSRSRPAMAASTRSKSPSAGSVPRLATRA